MERQRRENGDVDGAVLLGNLGGRVNACGGVASGAVGDVGSGGTSVFLGGVWRSGGVARVRENRAG